MFTDCVLPVGSGALACAMADCLDDDALALAAAFFTVLGDQLALLAAQRQICHKNE